MSAASDIKARNCQIELARKITQRYEHDRYHPDVDKGYSLERYVRGRERSITYDINHRWGWVPDCTTIFVDVQVAKHTNIQFLKRKYHRTYNKYAEIRLVSWEAECFGPHPDGYSGHFRAFKSVISFVDLIAQLKEAKWISQQ